MTPISARKTNLSLLLIPSMAVNAIDGGLRAEAALDMLPGGSNGEFNLPESLVTVVARGEGCRLWDTEGREYIDFSMGWGSALVGHAHPAVTEAVQTWAPHGANFACVNENMLRLAGEIIDLSPACDRVRFCASGTEATMYCQRLARAFTGRKKILKFEGAYHGANEIGVTSLFPSGTTNFPTPEPSSAGIDASTLAQILVAPFNDLENTADIVSAHANDLAAVIVEPLHRCLPPAEGFLDGLRALCDAHGCLLIFDEVVTGFRLAYGGAQDYYGVVPDLVAYGKALGGGLPIGAFGGRADIMELVREDRLNRDTYVWMASTLGGNPISTAAALAALRVFRAPGAYEHLHGLGRHLRAAMGHILDERGEVACVLGDGPLAQVAFTDRQVRNYRDTKTADTARSRALMLALFERGVFLNPMGTKLYLSLAHDETVCGHFLDRFDDALVSLPRR